MQKPGFLNKSPRNSLIERKSETPGPGYYKQEIVALKESIKRG